jgi:hypothetical protein
VGVARRQRLASRPCSNMDAFRRLFEAEERPRTLTVHWHLRHLALAVAPALLLAVLLEPTRRRLVRERAAAPVPTEAAPVEAGTSAATQTDPVAVDDTAALAERVAVLEQALQQALVRLTVREAVSAWAGRLGACTDPGPPPPPRSSRPLRHPQDRLRQRPQPCRGHCRSWA